MYHSHIPACPRYLTIVNPENPDLVRWRLRQICQVNFVRVNELTCEHRSPGAMDRCEVIGDHEDHRVGTHTIYHYLWGNGYPCWVIDNRLKEELEWYESHLESPWSGAGAGSASVR